MVGEGAANKAKVKDENVLGVQIIKNNDGGEGWCDQCKIRHRMSFLVSCVKVGGIFFCLS